MMSSLAPNRPCLWFSFQTSQHKALSGPSAGTQTPCRQPGMLLSDSRYCVFFSVCALVWCWFYIEAAVQQTWRRGLGKPSFLARNLIYLFDKMMGILKSIIVSFALVLEHVSVFVFQWSRWFRSLCFPSPAMCGLIFSFLWVKIIQ